MPVSRSFNKKKRRKKPWPATSRENEKASLNHQAAPATTSATPPITVTVNGQEIIVDDELIMALGGITGTDEVSLPTGNVKMSEVLVEFVEPFLAVADESYRRVFLSLAATCWNGALLPVDKRNEVKFADVEGAGWLGEVMVALVARKREVYADNNWMVKDYEIVGSGAEARIKVTSTVLLPQLVSK